MRRVTVWAPAGSRARLLDAAGRHGAAATLASSSTSPDLGEVDVVVAHLPNGRVDAYVEALTESVEDLRISLLPQGVLALQPPAEEAPDEVVDVDLRSPLEIVLSSLQSIGSLGSFLTYAALSGAVVFAAFYTNTVFLLIGAMLISPLAEPAMNAALATARGAGPQLLRSVGRYLAALGVGAAVAALLTVLYGLDEPTTLMTDVSSPSLAAVLLPLTAGVAGAVNIASSERSSLVSGAGPGLLIAASLAPPMGLVGMTLVQGEPGVAAPSVFLLALQLVGINVAAALVFRLVGVRPTGMRYARGRPELQWVAAALSLAALAALVTLQFLGSPNLRRESLEREAEQAARQALSANRAVHPVTIEAAFAREDIEGQRTVVVSGVAQRSRAAGEAASVEDAVAREVASAVERELPDTVALVDIAVAGR
ncbi:MAG TPA: DUF389 domain-containing protein [Solirubrobacteraceae bacterium]|nr:DUF389 domain-containing protein [Solirubrobacteraceae bacterium]